MNEDLISMQARLDEYQSELDKIVTEYHDEMTMAYFSDRFGPDHPQSPRADHGVSVQQKLIRMQKQIKEFSTEFLKEFPKLEGQ